VANCRLLPASNGNGTLQDAAMLDKLIGIVVLLRWAIAPVRAGRRPIGFLPYEPRAFPCAVLVTNSDWKLIAP
jgi:hypothetical protein